MMNLRQFCRRVGSTNGFSDVIHVLFREGAELLDAKFLAIQFHGTDGKVRKTYDNLGNPKIASWYVEHGHRRDTLLQRLAAEYSTVHDAEAQAVAATIPSILDQLQAIGPIPEFGDVAAGPLVRAGELWGVLRFARQAGMASFSDAALRDLSALCLHVSETLARIRWSPEPSPLESLPSRPRSICELVAAGYRNEEIASLLAISENTVKTHLKQVFLRLNISSRAELAAHVAKDQGALGRPELPLDGITAVDVNRSRPAQFSRRSDADRQ